MMSTEQMCDELLKLYHTAILIANFHIFLG